MKILKWIAFFFLMCLSFFFLFSQVSLKFIVFHALLVMIFFFPYYWWIKSYKSLLAVFFFLLVVGGTVFYFLPNLPDKKTNAVNQPIKMSAAAKVEQLQFTWKKQNKVYDFKKESIDSKIIHQKRPKLLEGRLFKWYQNRISKLISKINIKRPGIKAISFLLWLSLMILIAFIFSFSSSLLVSYSNICFILPYPIIMGEYLFVKNFTPLLFYIQAALTLVLLAIGFYRVKN